MIVTGHLFDTSASYVYKIENIILLYQMVPYLNDMPGAFMSC